MKNMPTFVITTKRANNCNGIRIEPGMQVRIVSNSFSNPVTTNGGQVVIDAFMRIYGIDIKKASLSILLGVAMATTIISLLMYGVLSF